MFLCNRKTKRNKCPHTEKIINTIENEEQLAVVRDIFKNRTFKIGDSLRDYVCFQYQDKEYKHCKCLRKHTREV